MYVYSGNEAAIAEQFHILFIFFKVGLVIALFAAGAYGVMMGCCALLSKVVGEKNVEKASAVMLALIAAFSVTTAAGRRKK